MPLDQQILVEIDRRASVYRTYKYLTMKPDGLVQQIVLDCELIQRVCRSEDYQTKPYINHYGKAISEPIDEGDDRRFQNE